MKSINFTKFAAVSALGFAFLLGTSELAYAQGKKNGDKKAEKQQDKFEKQQDKVEKKQGKVEKQQSKMDQQRQKEWAKRNARLVNAPSGNDRSNGAGFYNGNANANSNRYRVSRNGTSYNTDARGADLLRQAVNEGYRQGFNAGRSDSDGLGDWTSSPVYRTGTMGYQTYVDRNQYRYYFQQGFQRGYQDGTNSQYQNDYNGDYQYGTNNGGKLNILGTILNQILNIRNY